MTGTTKTDPMPKIQMSPVGRLEKIVLASDGSEFAESAERLALDLCDRAGASLHIVRAVMAGAWGFFTPGGATSLGDEAAAHLEKLSADASARGIPCTTAMPQDGDPADGIVKEAKRFQADLIIKGRRGAWEPTRLIVGDSTAKVIGNGPCPVLVVPRAGHLWSEIVIATDGSRSSDAATVMAATMSKHTGTPVVVLSVKVPSHSERRQGEAQAIVNRAVAYLEQEKVQAIGVVEDGLVDDVVIAASHEGDSLILLGTFGRTAVGPLLGSKTERIVKKAKGAVLVVGA